MRTGFIKTPPNGSPCRIVRERSAGRNQGAVPMMGTRQDTSGGGRGGHLGAPCRRPAVHPYPPPPSEWHRPKLRADVAPAGAHDRNRHWPAVGLILAVATLLTFVSAANGFMLGWIAGPTLAATGLDGQWRGGACKLLMLPAWFGLALLATLRTGLPDLFIDAGAGSPNLASSAIVCLGVLMVALIVAGRTAQRLGRRMVVAQRPSVAAFDRWLGAAIGMGQGLLIMLTLCWAIVLIEPQARAVLHHPNMPEESAGWRVASGIVRLTREINQTPLESIVHEANLLERAPFIRNALCDLADGQRLALDSTKPMKPRPPNATPTGVEPDPFVQPQPVLAVKQSRSKEAYQRQLPVSGIDGRSTQSSTGGGS